MQNMNKIDVLKGMERFFGLNLSEGYIAEWMAEAKGYDFEVLSIVAGEYRLAKQPFQSQMPTIGDFFIRCREIAAQREKKIEKRQDEETFDRMMKGSFRDETGYAQKSCELIRLALQGNITRKEFVKRVKELHGDQYVMEMIRYYEVHSLSLDGRIGDKNES